MTLYDNEVQWVMFYMSYIDCYPALIYPLFNYVH